jgi:nicotinamidase-related amidase
MPRSRRQRGGIQAQEVTAILAKENSDLNDFYNHYLIEAANGTDVIASSVPSGKDITNSIMVIDMQNDFTLPHPRGAFSVTDGVKMVRPLVSCLDDNADKCTKVVFSRDSHHASHCSFGSQGGIFPDHCVIDSPGAEMYGIIKEYRLLPNAEVIFKGMDQNTDSFGAAAYEEGEYLSERQVGTCCGATGSKGGCAPATGGFYLNITTEQAFGPRPFETAGPNWNNEKTAFNVASLLKGQTKGEHNVFVVGLAGDYCVRDTAINIGRLGPINGVKINVFVVEPLVRYAFVPLSVGAPLKQADLASGRNNSGQRKDLTKYAFTFDLNIGRFRILTATEAAGITNQMIAQNKEIVNAKGVNSYFHFLTDPRKIIKNYRDNNIKILMDMPDIVESPVTSAIDGNAWTNNEFGTFHPVNGWVKGGGNRKTKKGKKSKKSRKTRGRK